MFWTLIIICGAAYVIYKLARIAQELLKNNYAESIKLDEEASKSEKSTALALYGRDQNLPMLVYKVKEESEEKKNKIHLGFVFAVAIVVVLAFGMFQFVTSLDNANVVPREIVLQDVKEEIQKTQNELDLLNKQITAKQEEINQKAVAAKYAKKYKALKEQMNSSN